MNKSEQSFLDNDNTPDVIISQNAGPGARLKAIRENLGYSAEYVADNLRLKHHVIHTLEAEKYELLGSHVFIRGYIRAYALMMGVSQAELNSLLSQFNQLGLSDSNSTPVSLHPQPRRSSNFVETILQSISYLVFLGIAILVGTWWYSHQTADVIAIEKSTDLDAPNVIKAEADRSESLVLPKTAGDATTDTGDSDIVLPEGYGQTNSGSATADKSGIRTRDLISDHPDVPVAPIVPMNVSPSEQPMSTTTDASGQHVPATNGLGGSEIKTATASQNAITQNQRQSKNRKNNLAVVEHADKRSLNNQAVSTHSNTAGADTSNSRMTQNKSTGSNSAVNSASAWREPANNQPATTKSRFSPF